jgi:outer membrane protein TolC
LGSISGGFSGEKGNKKETNKENKTMTIKRIKLLPGWGTLCSNPHKKNENSYAIKLVLTILIGLIFLSFIVQAETITRGKYLDQLIEKHPLFEKEKLTAKIGQEEKNSYLGAQDWNIFASVLLKHEQPAIAFAGPERTDSIYTSAGVERLYWKTGGKLSASFSTGFANIKIDPLFNFPNNFFQNQFSIKYLHPIKKNKKGFLDRLQYNLKQFDIDFSEVEALENQENFVAAAAGRFLDWVLLTEQKKIVLERLKLSEEELARAIKKRKAHLIDQVDVMRAEDSVRIARQNLMLVDSLWKAVQGELAVLVQNNKIYNLSPEFNLYEFKELSSMGNAISQLKENSRLLKTLAIRLEQLDYARKGHEEMLKPDLWLVAEFNIKRIEKGVFRSFLMDKPDASLGFQLSFPVQKRTAKSQIAKTDLQISQLKKQVDEITLTLTSTLTNLYIQIKNMKKVLKLNVEQIESAMEKTKEELKLYNQGRGNMTFVIQSRDNEENARLTYSQNALNYHKLLIQYEALMDRIYNGKDSKDRSSNL